MSNNILDSRRWNEIQTRHGDVVLSTWAKAGTTWVQQILAQMILGDREAIPISQVSPWIENRYVPLDPMRRMLESQSHRRFMKSHLPANALAPRPGVKYIFIGRDGRDVAWSWYNHHRNLSDTFYEIMRNTPECREPFMVPPGEDVREYFLEWLEKDGYPLWPFWAHVRSWWALRSRPDVLLLHYDELKSDLSASVIRVGEFLGIDMAPKDVDRVVSRSTFSYMKTHADDLLPEQRKIMVGGGESFIHRGEGGSWRHLLGDSDIRAYESRMLDELGWECARWLSRPYEVRVGEASSARTAVGANNSV